MGSLMKRLEDIFAAAAFAEEGEHDTARQILRESKPGAEKKDAPAAYRGNLLPEEE